MKTKVLKIALDGRGSYLRALDMEKGCFVVRDKENNVEKYPLFENEIGEVVLDRVMLSRRARGFSGILGHRLVDR